MTTAMNNGTNKSGRLSRPTLAGQIDRLDSMLDGLAEALDQSVEQAVRDCVGRVVRDAVEQAVRDVLDDPDLVRAAVARHAPVAALAPDSGSPAKPRSSLAQALGKTLGWLCALAGGKASDAGKAVSQGWTWLLAKLRDAAGALSSAARMAASALPVVAGLAWKNKGICAAALGVGAAVALAAYWAGPLAASALCGLGGAAVSLGGWMIAAACRPFGGR